MFDENKKEMTELVDGIAFANGVQLTRKEDAVLICETTKARLLRYNLKGPKSGTLEVVNDNLPGLPDNIRPSSSGGYWIGFALIRKKGKFSFMDFCAEKPWLRSFIMKQVIPMDAILAALPKYGLLIEVDDNGNIMRSLHDPTGKVIPSLSEAEDKNGVLHFGSYNLPFMGRLYLARIR
ncbi:hypothetical protein FSP39_011140 [Pinctada imbricata]|uniref:Strictosidine synthase conserved region domain-containing protein n=1 Tax=Pinctada imbricata TaxID=66713 RepID=A0AA88XWC7_PINIB|nr:hypothetical protein FSP39_011140 [Pinctada imbricata]